ncbi:hypothetical protein H6F74_05600 [Trichocoleus sp. FACHB-90]|uniref:hypothetical protein n=1 Tax=Cyanophyceae TaxID=3028117 RepID=UPI001683736B|nr:hypothetical protein [Trichocoleus sp. FACHB-90]MBD1925757.1 hypothetical protein [Trichocoleus sp. FACHB-90]
MAIYTHSEVKNIGYQLQANSNYIHTLIENFDDFEKYKNRGLEAITVNTFLKNLKVYSEIRSTAEVPLPEFELTDTDTDRLAKTLIREWKGTRKQLNLHWGVDDTPWMPIGSVSLINVLNYPFTIHNAMDLLTDNLAAEIGVRSRIGVSISDVGHGLLTDKDKVVIYGSYVTEWVTATARLKPIEFSNPFSHPVTSTSSVLLRPNAERKQFTIKNPDTNPCFLNFGNTAEQGRGIFLGGKDAYEYNTDNYPYFGTVSVVCFPQHDGTINLVGMECW